MYRVVAFGLLLSGLMAAQQDTAPAADPHESSRRSQSASTPRQTPQAEAWQILESACTSDKAADREAGVGALGLLPGNSRARKMAETALEDNKAQVRSAAVESLARMHSKASLAKLRKTVDDADPVVGLAAARALIALHDDSGFDVYYEVLTGQRRGSKGLIASQTDALKDPKKMAELGIQAGIGFVPFGGMGWRAYKTLHKDDGSPVRAAAAKVLSKDPDPNTTEALTDAAGDRSWGVRVAALEALAERGDASALPTVEMYMSDERDSVRYTAAAAVLRLSAVKEGHTSRKRGKESVPQP